MTDADRPALRFDELDRRLLAELGADPRASYAALGQRLGVTGMTAANRLQRLRSSGLVRLRAVPNLRECGLETSILGLVKTNLPALESVQAALTAWPYVLSVYRVTGEFDLAFEAAFPNEPAMGDLVREVQSVAGVQQLVVHHRIETVRDDDGWRAVLSEGESRQESPFELAPGTVVPRHLQQAVAVAGNWVDALAAADIPRLQRISAPGISFTIMPPHPSAGIFEGMEALERQAHRTRRAYNKLWYRLIGVNEGKPPFAVVLDALSPVEDSRGQVGTRFSRMAFAFQDGRVSRVVSLGQMDLPEVPDW